MRRLTMAHYVTLAGVLALAAAAGYLGYRRFAPSPATAARLTTQAAALGTVVSMISATGNVTSPATSRLSFSSGGRLSELLVGIGSAVQAGQALARIDPAELEVALAQAWANLSSAEAKLAQTRAGATVEDLAAAQAQLDAARLKLEQTRAVAQGPEVTAAQSQVDSARLKLEQLLAGARPDELAAAQTQRDTARARLEGLLHPREEDVAVARSQVESARIKLEQLRYPRPDNVRGARAQLASAQARQEALRNPRPEDLASAQPQVDQARTPLAQLVDHPCTATAQDIANAQLQVQNAQVGLANDHLSEILSGLQAGEQVVIPSTTTAGARLQVPGVAGIGAGPGVGGPPPSAGPR